MLEEEIKLLREAVQELTATLKSQPAEEPKKEPKKEAKKEPESNDDVTERDVGDLTLAKSRDGHRNAIRAKLNEMGKERIGVMNQSELREFKTFLEAL